MGRRYEKERKRTFRLKYEIKIIGWRTRWEREINWRIEDESLKGPRNSFSRDKEIIGRTIRIIKKKERKWRRIRIINKEKTIIKWWKK